ncbi:hypothetical protein Fmac_004441 [Flemingia macrophylla]|uniref:Uncharacterized protein n=1 Tax=Flemingia macrophylla TaxID=520843 RepID=A0ABD1N5K6_9FABA
MIHQYSICFQFTLKKRKMETLISQLTFFPDQKLLEIESYKAWVAVELEQEKEVEEADVNVIMNSQQGKGPFESAMQNAASVASKMYIEAALNSAIASSN